MNCIDKFPKNDIGIPKPRNFAVVKVMFGSFFVFLFSLAFHPAATFGIPGSISFPNDLNPFLQNGKVGLKNQKGEILIPAQYEALGWSNGSFSVVENVTGYRSNGKWGLVNLTNHKVTSPEYETLAPGSASLIVAHKKFNNSISVQAGCISPSGKVIIPFQYDGLRISNLRAIVYKRDGYRFRHGLIDLSNRNLIPLEYQNIYPLGSLRFAVVSFDNKTAIFSENGSRLSDFSIDSISLVRNDRAVIYQNQLQGLMNRDGEILLEPVFREIKILDDGAVMTRKNNSWVFLDGDNNLLREIHADEVKPLQKNLYEISSGGSSHLANRELQPVRNLFFSSIGEFQNGKAVFTSGNRKGVIRKNGTILIPAEFNSIFLEEGFIRASQGGPDVTRWRLLDSAGRAITPRTYEYIGSFNGKFFVAKNRGFWGALDSKGKEFVACVHDSLLRSVKDHIVVKFKGQYGIIDVHENWVVTPQPHRLQLLDDGLYLEFTPSNKFLKSLKGEVIYFTENRIDVRSGYLLEYLPSGAVWRVNMEGVITDRFVLPEGVDKTFPESEGYRAILKDGKYGFIDSRSRLRIANRYEDVKNFSEGLAGAKILGKWGYINKEDRITIQPVYDEVFAFANGYAVVRQKNFYGVIDKVGKVILPMRYDEVEMLAGDKIRLRLNGSYGLADTSGKIIVNPKYDRLELIDNNYLIVSREGKHGVVTTGGMSTIPLIYDALTFDAFHRQFLAMKKSGWEKVTF